VSDRFPDLKHYPWVDPDEGIVPINREAKARHYRRNLEANRKKNREYQRKLKAKRQADLSAKN